MVYILFRKNKTKISCIKKTKQKKERVREETDKGEAVRHDEAE